MATCAEALLHRVVACCVVTVEVTQILQAVQLLRLFPDAALPLTYPSPSFTMLLVGSATSEVGDVKESVAILALSGMNPGSVRTDASKVLLLLLSFYVDIREEVT